MIDCTPIIGKYPDRIIRIIQNLPYTKEEIITILDLDRGVTLNRIKRGVFVEDLTGSILQYGEVITGHDGRPLPVRVRYLQCKFTAGMTWEQRNAEILDNAVNGDLQISVDNGPWINIDVKEGSRIALDSLNRFRNDGLYMMNSLARSNGKFHFMVQNNDELRKAIFENSIPDGPKKNLYDVHFEMHLNIGKYPLLKIDQQLDPGKYFNTLNLLEQAFYILFDRKLLAENVA